MTNEQVDPNNNSDEQASIRKDFNACFRHQHKMSMQTKHDMIDVTSRVFAMLEEMIANGQLDLKSFEERRLRIQQKEEQRVQNSAIVYVDNTIDKYKLEDSPKIDCESRLDLCKARCCKLAFALSFQDLDEGVLKWNYSQPYQISQKEDGYCIHHGGDGKGCLVYENRPAVCRNYDCWNDKRIWVDYEKRIVAPEKELEKLKLPSER